MKNIKTNYSSVDDWDRYKGYNIGDLVKHELIIFEAVASNKGIEPIWPRPLENPWKLKIM